VDYADAFTLWNFVSSIGAYVAGIGTLVFLYVLYEAFAAKRVAPANPWGEGATTLEWTVPSPPPFHQFETPPAVLHDGAGVALAEGGH
jgi:cytochrome c oxidase subunit 1